MTTTSQETDSLSARLSRELPKGSAAFENADLQVKGVETCDQALDRLEKFSSSHITETEFLEIQAIYTMGLKYLWEASASLLSRLADLKSAAERDSGHHVEKAIKSYEDAMECHEKLFEVCMDQQRISNRFANFVVSQVNVKRKALSNGRENGKPGGKQ